MTSFFAARVLMDRGNIRRVPLQILPRRDAASFKRKVYTADVPSSSILVLAPRGASG
jgi:hypothetical protein